PERVRGDGYLTTSDFPAALLSLARATLTDGYLGAPRTFPVWTRRTTLPDFRPMNRLAIGTAPKFVPVPEHAEYQRGTLGAHAEQNQLKTWGRILALTRQALVNDDLSAFTRARDAVRLRGRSDGGGRRVRHPHRQPGDGGHLRPFLDAARQPRAAGGHRPREHDRGAAVDGRAEVGRGHAPCLDADVPPLRPAARDGGLAVHVEHHRADGAHPPGGGPLQGPPGGGPAADRGPGV